MIELRNLRKDFGHTMVIENMSLVIEAGSWLGIIGPPRSGLSSLMRLIAGFLVPTDGQVLINGRDTIRDRQQLSQILSYVPSPFTIPPAMMVGDFIVFCARLRRLPNPRDQALALCAELGLDDIWKHPLGQLDPSLQQLVVLAQALLHQPKLLLLDEPFLALDSWQRPRALQWLSKIASTTTCVLSSHQLDELHPLCQRILIFHEGRIHRTIDTEDMKNPRRLALALNLKGEGQSR